MQTLIALSAVLSLLAAEPSSDSRPASSHAEVARSEAPAEHSTASIDKLHLIDAQHASIAEPPATAKRILMEAVSGYGVGLTGLAVYGAIGAPTRNIWMLLPVTALTLGSSLGVAYMGLQYVDGNFGLALLGSVAGLAVPVLATLAGMGVCGSQGCAPGFFVGVGLGLLLLPPLGAILGFELSASPRPARHASKYEPARRIVPVLAPSGEGGAMVGIAGTL